MSNQGHEGPDKRPQPKSWDDGQSWKPPEPEPERVVSDDPRPTFDGIPRNTLLAILAGTAVVVVIGLVFLSRDSGDNTEEAEPTEALETASDEPVEGFEIPPVPERTLDEPQIVTADDWGDPLVAELANFVEEQRGLRFQEPVPIKYISNEEMAGPFDGGYDPFLDERIRILVASYRAVGLIQGDLDVAGIRSLQESGIFGMYTQEGVISVRNDLGGEVGSSPFARVVLVHELTHALQDQQIDIFGTEVYDYRRLSMQGMMVEGDARRIQAAYTASLTDEERQSAEEAVGGVSSTFSEAGIVPVLGIEGQVTYDGGSQVTRLVDVLDGSGAVDNLLGYPPDSPAQLLRVSQLFVHPSSPWTSDIEFVEFPEPPFGSFPIDGGSLGAWQWYVTFAVRLDVTEALRAAESISSDQYVLFEEPGGRICGIYDLITNGAAERGYVSAAVADWATTLPHGAEVSTDGDTTTITACDPGAGADMAFLRTPGDIVAGPIARLGAVSDVLAPQQGWWADDELKERERWCLAESVIRAISIDEALAGLDDGRIAALGEAAVRSCLPERVPGGEPPIEGECSAEGLEFGAAPDGLPEGVAEARTAVLGLTTACDYAGLRQAMSTNQPLLGNENLDDVNDPGTLVQRWTNRENAGQHVLARLVSTFGSGWFCGPAVAGISDAEGGGCAWVWSGDGPVDSEAYVAVIADDGTWLGFGENPSAQDELMALWAAAVDGQPGGSGYTWSGQAEGSKLPSGWPPFVAPGAQLETD